VGAIGRIIAGGFFLMNGFNHFAKLGMMSGYAKSKGTPLSGLAVGGSGVLLVLGGASLLLGYRPTVGAARQASSLPVEPHTPRQCLWAQIRPLMAEAHRPRPRNGDSHQHKAEQCHVSS
jgi:hypothetical protein